MTFLHDRTIQSSNPSGDRNFSLIQSIQISSGTHKHSITDWVPDFLPWSKAGWDVKLTTHLQVVLKLRMSGDTPTILHKSSWRAQGQLYLHLLCKAVPFKYQTQEPARTFSKLYCLLLYGTLQGQTWICSFFTSVIRDNALKNGGILFDRPRLTAGCSANGRRRRDNAL